MSTKTSTHPHRKAARERVVETATRLFYAEGVHTVGIDRIIAEAGVAKATFYHHFASKDDLVREYVVEQSRRQRAVAERVTPETPRDMLMTAFELLCQFAAEPGYRGCPFINAAAEYPDPSHPVRQAIDEHRTWIRGLFRDLLAAEGHPTPDRTAEILTLLKDGLAVALNLDTPTAAREATREAITQFLQTSSPSPALPLREEK